ncbi:complement C1r-A subcomponent [Syngnathoides biaculeatus]|uniref:complement C1r-A subcomponent n=1 Tax=Syngnathoides biaculeatus TaxID=300417 RepID=UPI002ADE0538|nr:complement C1r-A subcomponent [Syngnathoides biaculeatus]
MQGQIQSPGYPKPYPPNLRKQWDLSVPEGFQLHLTFTHLDIEESPDCRYDALTIFYGNRILGKFCGYENSTDEQTAVLSPGNRLTLVFQTNGSNTKGQNVGFSANYRATVSCGRGIFNEPMGYLSSPRYPRSPPHAVSCQYVISVKTGFTVTLKFSDYFHIESNVTAQDLTCPHHWLQVTIPGAEPWKLCGGRSPGVIATNSSRVTLDYHTDEKDLSNGWRLEYSTHRVRCPHPGAVANGIVPSFLTNFFYGDYVFVHCNPGHRLMMDGQEMESFSTKCQKNGQWHRRLPECQLIRCKEPEPLQNGWVKYLSGSRNEYLSVIQYGCISTFHFHHGGDNVTFTCQADGQWRSNTANVVTPLCSPACGRPTASVLARQSNVTSGTAPKGALPWQAVLRVHGSRAAAMVIGDRWLMTTAHSLVHSGRLEEPENVQIYVGHTDIASMLGTPVSPASLHVHPGYNNADGLNFDNDIALIRLEEALTFSASLMPICLPTDDALYHSDKVGVISGSVMTLQRGRRVLVNKQMYSHLPVVGQDTCQSSISTWSTLRRVRVPTLTDNMFCAGPQEVGLVFCYGFGGSPFAVYDNASYWAAGIVSWGTGCGEPGTYEVFTKVINYVDWIRKTIQDNN